MPFDEKLYRKYFVGFPFDSQSITGLFCKLDPLCNACLKSVCAKQYCFSLLAFITVDRIKIRSTAVSLLCMLIVYAI